MNKRPLREIRRMLHQAHQGLKDFVKMGGDSNKVLDYWKKRIGYYEDALDNYGRANLLQVTGKLKNGKNFTIYLCNVEDTEVTELLNSNSLIDFENGLQLKTLKTKTILT
jgi:hypothetical protein